MEDSLRDCGSELSKAVLGAAIDVHRELGPGLLESVYERALAFELRSRGLDVEEQVPVRVAYRGTDLGLGFRADVVVDRVLLLEIKSVDGLNRAHVAQVLNYLKLLKLRRGLLINFNVPLLKQGIRRISI